MGFGTGTVLGFLRVFGVKEPSGGALQTNLERPQSLPFSSGPATLAPVCPQKRDAPALNPKP